MIPKWYLIWYVLAMFACLVVGAWNGGLSGLAAVAVALGMTTKFVSQSERAHLRTFAPEEPIGRITGYYEDQGGLRVQGTWDTNPIAVRSDRCTYRVKDPDKVRQCHLPPHPGNVHDIRRE